MTRRRVNFTIDSHIDLRLNELAQSEQVSRSEVVNRAIDRYDAGRYLDATADWWWEMDSSFRYTAFSATYDQQVTKWSGVPK